MSLVELNGFRVEAALQFGFEMTNDNGDEYSCTETQLLAFARACERKGRADAAKIVRARSDRTLIMALKYAADYIDLLANATDEQIARETTR